MRTSEKKTKKNEGENEHSDDEDSNKDNKEIEEKDDENPMPPFPIKSPTLGTNDLPSMRKELRMQLQLAIKATREKGTREKKKRIKKERKIKKRVKTMTITITMMKSECWRTLWKV